MEKSIHCRRKLMVILASSFFPHSHFFFFLFTCEKFLVSNVCTSANCDQMLSWVNSYFRIHNLKAGKFISNWFTWINIWNLSILLKHNSSHLKNKWIAWSIYVFILKHSLKYRHDVDPVITFLDPLWSLPISVNNTVFTWWKKK